MKLRICLIDDDESIRADVARAVELADNGVVMTPFGKPRDLLEAIERSDGFDVALWIWGSPR